jgi:hypothetical protein
MNATVFADVPAPTARREADGFAHPDHPIVVQVRDATRSGAADLPATALKALERAPGDGLLVEARINAVDIYARTPAAAEAALASLRDVPRGLLDVIGPEVRYRPGPPPCEPVMTIAASMPVLFVAFVRRELLRRRGQIRAIETERRAGILRADVPLAPLLGFERWIAALTDRRGQVEVAFSHYAPLRPDGAPAPQLSWRDVGAPARRPAP